MKRIIFTILVIIWMLLIFWFSAKPVEESSDMSLSVGKVVGEIFVSDYQKWPKDDQTRFAEKIDYPVRKAAHALEYTVFGLLLMAMYTSYHVKGRRCLMASFLTGVAYAATDEIHQLFVPGRGCRFTDVLIDSGGVLLGILLYLLIISLFFPKILDFSRQT